MKIVMYADVMLASLLADKTYNTNATYYEIENNYDMYMKLRYFFALSHNYAAPTFRFCLQVTKKRFIF
jgi:hypothetical protein